jgi:HAE1 family hydrophobic/amphiphilic exporter-1
MNLIRTAIDRPIAVVAAVLMWPGAAPAEVEREITNRQEEEMAGLEGLREITGRAEQGRSRVTLEFAVGANMDRALLLVANRLDRVTGYPEEADEPTLDTAGSEDSPIAWFIVRRAEGNERPVHEFGDFVEDVIKDRIERVTGVSRSTSRWSRSCSPASA